MFVKSEREYVTLVILKIASAFMTVIAYNCSLKSTCYSVFQIQCFLSVMITLVVVGVMGEYVHVTICKSGFDMWIFFSELKIETCIEFP